MNTETELRRIFPEVLKSLGNGAGCTETCSLEFLQTIPEEVKLVIDSKDTTIQALKDRISKLEASIKELQKEVDEADRSAGKANRLLEYKTEECIKRQDWLSKAKKQWGCNDNVSFDVIWEEALALKGRF